MKSPFKRILPILLVIVVLCSIIWYLFIYDKEFTRDLLLYQARLLESYGKHEAASWLYDLAYHQSDENEQVAIELAEQFKANGNYTKAEHTLSNAIADGGSAELYIALCKTYVEQNKLLDAVTMLDNVSDPEIKAQLSALRPAAPVSSPAPGFYSQYINVTVECTSGTLYVSSDGEYPSVKEDLYGDGVPLQAGENTIYALSIGENGLVSPLSIFGYTVGGVIEEVTLSDSALNALVRQMLEKGESDRLLTSDLWTITTLTMPEEAETFADLQYFPYLTSLTVANSSVSDLLPLASLTQLTKLSISGSAVSQQGLAVIATLPKLTDLTLSGCSLSSIKTLAGAKNLEYLNLSSNTVRDISPLSFMSKLTSLDLSHNALTNLSALSALHQLQSLNVSYNSLASLVPLADCTQLKQLDVSHNAIGELTGVAALKSLETFNASNNQLTQADLLSGSTALKELLLAHNTILDVTGLASLTGLQYFDISYNEIEALPQWGSDCALVHINGSYNKLTSLDSLSGYQNLNTVLMDYNQITSVDALASCPSLIRVDVNGNTIEDVSKLKEQSIIVNYTPIV